MTMPVPPEKFEFPHHNVADAAERLYATMADDLWAKATFEQKQQMIMNGLRGIGALIEERALRESTTTAERIEIEEVVYSRLKQSSNVCCFGMWGSYRIAEPLYREVGVHNGRTIKPLEKAAGLITKTMT